MSYNAISDPWPQYFEVMLNVKDVTSNIGIITLWSKKEIYVEALKDVDYNTIGQLYSREEGLSYLIRNLLANKHITDLVVVGTDLNKCGPALKAFFENGVDENHEIICEHYGKIDYEISKEAIESVRRNVKLHDLRDIKDKEKIAEYVEQIPKSEAYGDFELFKEAEVTMPEVYPSDNTVFKVRGKTVGDVWVDILKQVSKFGIVKKTSYGDKQKEVVSLISVVTDEDPDNIKWSEDFEFTKEELDFYTPQVTTSSEFDGLEYTYGQRLMNHDGIDQIKSMIDELKGENYSRRAIASTWNVAKDYNNPKCPCLDLIQALVQENKLTLTCYIRSNDMYGAWPRNALALRKLQKNICEQVGVEMGNLVIISNSAHIYERDFNKSFALVEKHQNKIKWNTDPNGSILINIEGKEIVVTHLDTQGKKLDTFKVESAIEGYKKIGSELKISDITHAMDIGCELQKAEIAIKLGIEYLQDKKLKLKE